MTASAASARHETRALLRAHLSAATSYRHLTRHCPICHRLERLALEASSAAQSAREGDCDGDREPGEEESPPDA
ncbi:DUF6274 family protein [Streptomyces sp. NPDC050147]|uniref:DUF6274 family protein n=1 Tax=Streptomyces sp. NPDC050147 TaxID=3155513 RepID=UPI003444111E